MGQKHLRGLYPYLHFFQTEMKRTNADKLLNEAHLNRELSNTSGSLHSSPNASSHDSCGLSTTDTSSGRSRSSSSDGSSLGKTPIIKDSKRRLTPEVSNDVSKNQISCTTPTLSKLPSQETSTVNDRFSGKKRSDPFSPLKQSCPQNQYINPDQFPSKQSFFG